MALAPPRCIRSWGLVFGLPEELAVALTGEESSEPPVIDLGGLAESQVVPPGASVLLRRQLGVGGVDDAMSLRGWGGNSSVPSATPVVWDSLPTFGPATGAAVPFNKSLAVAIRGT